MLGFSPRAVGRVLTEARECHDQIFILKRSLRLLCGVLTEEEQMYFTVQDSCEGGMAESESSGIWEEMKRE